MKESEKDSTRHNIHVLRLKVVFQILYFIRYEGMTKNFLHVLLGVLGIELNKKL